MSVLHLVTRSPHDSQALRACLCRLGSGDGILLLADGVYALTATAVMADLIVQLQQQGGRGYVLRDDLDLRGLSNIDCPEAIARVDYPGFVTLSQTHRLCLNWC
ncbi:MAG: sulfurtransferase complex subunit TusB [Methylococcaceae bacterium]